VLIPLGRHALAHFAPGEKISEVHGSLVISRERTLFPMYHPAAALHAKGLRDTLFTDAKALSKALSEG
jgi:uracil-DNA glycosylase